MPLFRNAFSLVPTVKLFLIMQLMSRMNPSESFVKRRIESDSSQAKAPAGSDDGRGYNEGLRAQVIRWWVKGGQALTNYLELVLILMGSIHIRGICNTMLPSTIDFAIILILLIILYLYPSCSLNLRLRLAFNWYTAQQCKCYTVS